MTTNARSANTFTESLLAALISNGLPAEWIGTGGGCEAIEARVSPTDYLLITNGDAELPNGVGGFVARYRDGDDPEPVAVTLDTLDETTVEQFVAAAIDARF